MVSRKDPSRAPSALLLLAALAIAPSAAAQGAAEARVLVTAPEGASPLLQEALVRAQGELLAVGLQPRLELRRVGGAAGAPPLPGGVFGLLLLEQVDGAVLIRAWAPRARQPVDARVELNASGVTAEVIAVRAVETLRAAMLQFAQATDGEVPQAVRGFTRFAPQPPRPARSEPPPAVPPAPSPTPPLAFWAGPAVSLHAGTSPEMGAQVGVLVGPPFGFAAAALESTLADLHLESDEGSASVRRQAVWAQLGARFRPARDWEVTTRAGAGYAAFSIEGSAAAGYRGRQAAHGSAAFMLGVSGGYWATRAFGLYASVGGRLVTDAPTVVIAGTPVSTLDRPSFVLSLGVSVGVF